MYGSVSRASSTRGVPEITPVSGSKTRLPLAGRLVAVNCSGSPSASVKLLDISRLKCSALDRELILDRRFEYGLIVFGAHVYRQQKLGAC